jgi:hypothetical protein
MIPKPRRESQTQQAYLSFSPATEEKNPVEMRETWGTMVVESLLGACATGSFLIE